MNEQQINERISLLRNDQKICETALNEFSYISNITNLIPAINHITKTHHSIIREIDLLTQIIQKNENL